jgi:hypothetical protein
MAKRSKSKTAKIRKLLAKNPQLSVQELAQQFGVSNSMVYNIRAKLKAIAENEDMQIPVKQIFPVESDNVNAPAHYTDGGIETIDYIEAKGLGYHLGNVVKYISRAGKKGTDLGMQDLRKAQWYLTRAIEKNEFQSPTR